MCMKLGLDTNSPLHLILINWFQIHELCTSVYQCPANCCLVSWFVFRCEFSSTLLTMYNYVSIFLITWLFFSRAAILAYSRETNFFYAFYVMRTLTAMTCEGSINCLALAYVVRPFPTTLLVLGYIYNLISYFLYFSGRQHFRERKNSCIWTSIWVCIVIICVWNLSSSFPPHFLNISGSTYQQPSISIIKLKYGFQ